MPMSYRCRRFVVCSGHLQVLRACARGFRNEIFLILSQIPHDRPYLTTSLSRLNRVIRLSEMHEFLCHRGGDRIVWELFHRVLSSGAYAILASNKKRAGLPVWECRRGCGSS